jgi:hypothetical protein
MDNDTIFCWSAMKLCRGHWDEIGHPCRLECYPKSRAVMRGLAAEVTEKYERTQQLEAAE